VKSVLLQMTNTGTEKHEVDKGLEKKNINLF